ncbi:nudix hydrolase 18, mitochondrial-like [Coffea eugenioides]|uniref:nudix hydrolase 18, mitochondrial-like n=1 Tax=Coffea eugenioides TaxID=49369 RepID=UPI000F60DDD9|nr:nudix hydrolase 18, mitochondrial-like [Coffea eugenioides]
MELKNMVALVSRTGRHLQRYERGCRQVVGCIPYRIKLANKATLVDEDSLEVLVISAQRKGKGVLFPKGGWETDEDIFEAAERETVEEAGVVGDVQKFLGHWNFENQNKESFMFAMQVREQLEFWPEQDKRQRIWMSVAEARKECKQKWMKDALENLVKWLTDEAPLASSSPSQERRSNL